MTMAQEALGQTDSDQRKARERNDRVETIRKALGVSADDAYALATGRYTLHYDPQEAYWERIRPSAPRAIAAFMTRLNASIGAFRAPDATIHERVAQAFPWLWERGVVGLPKEGAPFTARLDARCFPRIAFVPAESVPDVVLQEGFVWLDDLLLARENERITEVFERDRARRQGEKRAEEREPEAPVVTLNNLSWLWPKGISKCESWWRFRHLPTLPDARLETRELLWSHVERVIALAVEHIASYRRYAVSEQPVNLCDAERALELWGKTGNLAFGMSGAGDQRVLYVLADFKVTS